MAIQGLFSWIAALRVMGGTADAFLRRLSQLRQFGASSLRPKCRGLFLCGSAGEQVAGLVVRRLDASGIPECAGRVWRSGFELQC